jgi:hypothetical protein
MMFLLIVAVLGVVVGLGWSLPAIGVAYLKSLMFPKEKSSGTAEMAFLAEWVLLQGILGWITIIGFPVAFFFVDAVIVFHLMLLYFIASLVSAVLLWAVLFSNK